MHTLTVWIADLTAVTQSSKLVLDERTRRTSRLRVLNLDAESRGRRRFLRFDPNLFRTKNHNQTGLAIPVCTSSRLRHECFATQTPMKMFNDRAPSLLAQAFAAHCGESPRVSVL